MGNHLLRNARVILPDRVLEDGYLIARDGQIREAGVGYGGSLDQFSEVTDCENRYLSPGFIDIHTHGGGGCDFMDGTVEDIVTAARSHLKHGTTSIVPTTMTSSDEDLYLFLDNFKEAAKRKDSMPELLGVHLEGPYFAPAQAGAQPPEYMLKPEPEYYRAVLDYGEGRIMRWSSAPELPGALELGDELQKRGVMAAIGHTDANYEEMGQAVLHGYRHVTHLYSGMSSITRKEGRRILGAVESSYLLDELTVEIIADGIHLPPELLRLVLKCKDHDSICLVTDSMRGAGMPEGPSVLGSKKNGLPVMIEGGIAMMPDRSGFAGSVATTDRLVRVMTKQAGLSMWEAVKMITINPARFAGVDGRKGSLEPGKDADMLIFDDDVRIQDVYVSGKRISCNQ